MEVKKPKSKEDYILWAQSVKEKGQRLVAFAQSLSPKVFTSIENLISFLDLAARIHYYDAYNLLLIWDRCPNASCLAGYKVWERQLPRGAQILKKEHMGKGIELVAPFTDGFHQQSQVVWFSVIVFDISQTTLAVPPPAFDSGYFLDDRHEYFLLDALRMVIGTVYERSVLISPPTQLQQEAGLSGHITDQAVFVRDDLPLKEQLQWLTESMIVLEGTRQGLLPASLQLFIRCVGYCLFRIWRLEDYAVPPHSIQLNGAAQQEMPFLHQVRDSLRFLNNLICSCYIASRQDSDDSDDIDIEDLLGFIQTGGNENYA